jgi:nucleoid-associated protein EbfC
MNMQNLMAQAQRMQRDLQKKQAEIYEMEFTSTSGAVTAKLNGKKEIIKIEIDKSILHDEEDLEALEDMVKIAINDAIKQIEKTIEQKLGGLAKGLNGLM